MKKIIINILIFSALILNINLVNAQTGATCADSDSINLLPFVEIGLTTDGVSNDYNSTMACLSDYMNGNDYVFCYTPVSDVYINIKLSNTGQGVGLFVTDSCPDNPNANCISKVESLIGNPEMSALFLSGNNTYFIIVSTIDPIGGIIPNPSTAFDIEVTEQINSTCSDPYYITSLPFTETGFTTDTAGNNYSSADACGSSYMNGNDYVFSYTPGSDIYVNIKLLNTGQGTGLFVTDKCPDDTNAVCVAVKEETLGNPEIYSAYLTKDTVYYIIVSTNDSLGSNPSTNFDIEIKEISPFDAGITSITAPMSDCSLSDTETVSVIIKNFGADSIYSFDIAYTIDGGAPVTETFNDTILPGDSSNYNFTTEADFSTNGHTYQLLSYTILVNDTNNLNDTASASITNLPTISSYPYFEDFESGNGGWTDEGTNSSWQLGTPAAPIINNAASGSNAWVTNLTGNYNAMETSYVLGPCFDFRSLNSPKIELKIWYDLTSMFDAVSTTLQYSTDAGATWINVGQNGDPDNWYNTANGWNGSISGWITARHNLDGLGGESDIKLRINFTGSFITQTEGFAFDDIKISETSAHDLGVVEILSPVSDCGLTDNETITVKIKNFGSANQSNFPVSYSIDGGTNYTTENVTNTISAGNTINYGFTITADMSVTGDYDIVATTGLTTDTIHSNDTTKITVTNSLSIDTFPYTENFESGNGGWTAGGTNSSWQLGTPAAPTINDAGSGSNSWVTNLTGDCNTNENSFVISPCFNFTNIPNPAIKLNIWYEMMTGIAVSTLEASINGGSWQIIGTNGDTTNWYNSIITGTGWTGNSGQWIEAEHLLNNLGGQNNVKLKITFNNTLMSTPMEGFAFDDIYIYNWICTPPVANFTYNVNGFTVEFTNTSTNATSYSWNFGDANTSTDTDPTHTYASNGTYSITLIAISDCSSDTIIQNVLITGIEETSNNNIISCYPNPTNGLFYINIDCSKIENVEIIIENVIGSIVYSEKIGTILGIYNKQFDFSDFSKGIYYLKINSTTQNFVKKIVIE